MSPEGKKYNHLHNVDTVKFAEPDENSFDVLLGLVNTVKNKGLILESKLYLALIYALYGRDNALRHQDFPADTASSGFLDSKELYLADLAELFLYNKEMDKFRKVLGTLEKISENLLLDVNHNPVYLHTRIAILHAMSSLPWFLGTISSRSVISGRSAFPSLESMITSATVVNMLLIDDKVSGALPGNFFISFMVLRRKSGESPAMA